MAEILLVRPKPHKNTINLQSFMICEPLELEYLAAAAEKNGHSADIADLILEKKPLRKIISEKKYDFVAFTSYLTHVGVVKDYCAIVKKYFPDIKTIVGGVHAEVVPEDFDDPNIDYVVGGDSVKMFLDIISGGTPENNGGFFICPAGFYPDREKTAHLRKHYNYIYHDKCATMKTSYGCPYDCDFCFCTQITKNRYFQRDLTDVVGEIKTIREENIFIVDDNFLVSAERVLEFCRLINENNIKKKFLVFGRADFIAENKECLTEFRDAGLGGIFVGIESFTPTELENYNKRVKADINIRAIRIMEELGLETYLGLMTAENWRREDFDNLISQMSQFKHPFVNIQPVTPIPGTPLYERKKDEVVFPRERYELWDMAHILFKPTGMSVRKYYYNIVRAYIKIIKNQKAKKYITEKYGKKTAKRCTKGAVAIFFQYLKLMIRG